MRLVDETYLYRRLEQESFLSHSVPSLLSLAVDEKRLLLTGGIEIEPTDEGANGGTNSAMDGSMMVRSFHGR